MTQNLKFVRCICVVRSAHFGSIPALQRQRDAIRAFATEKQMSVVGEVILDGVPYGVPKQTVTELLHRKYLCNDFDVLVAADPSRLARGCDHFAALMQRLNKAGIEVAFVAGPHDSYARYMEAFADYSFLFVRKQRKRRRSERSA